MSNRQGKCPGCGLVNPPDVSECRCCGFVLRAGARARSSSDAYAKPSSKAQSRGGLPFGWLIVSVLLVMGLAGTWHNMRENAAREARLAEAAEKAEDDEKPGKKSGPPSLSGSSPGERRRGDTLRELRGKLDNEGVVGRIERATQEHERDVYGEKEAKRAAEARARAARKKQAEASWLER